MPTTLKLRVRTNPGDSTVAVPLTMAEVDDNFISLKTNKAELDSPTFTGTPEVPTQSQATNSTVAASTAYVRQAIVENDPIPMAIALG